ncbi:MAG: thiosulfate oxidation carrier complex protein SoxZ [Rhodospirillaceae bacterium]|nr:thiosulfate oxidation carrier complex protein SoxZ [Rhodospirillaceae bacterium]MBT4700579.1 thiosulfate oxidation carrier complex protein SoxZ [Rhodospirillaceae bacterium]MBT6221550.1 thiosulfate oxidation carrier complex protein SoxZ [Rhodospirillaceae bacterium]MBT6361681.1 thiosulfate oxidation carrier complex protein SoxZ [Rhodospirillaceae bacterium]
MTATLQIKVPNQAKLGEVIMLRAKLRHPMETGWRKDSAGKTVPRKRAYKFFCEFEGQEVFRADLHSGISADPYLAFYTKALRSGRYRFKWYEDGGRVYEKSATIEVIS